MAATEVTARPPRDEEEGGTAAFWCSLVNRVVTAEDCASCIVARTLCAEIGPWGGETAKERNAHRYRWLRRIFDGILENRDPTNGGETVKGMEKAVERMHEQMEKDYRDGCERASQSVARGEIDPVRAEKILVTRKYEEFDGKSESYTNGFIDTLKEILRGTYLAGLPMI